METMDADSLLHEQRIKQQKSDTLENVIDNIKDVVRSQYSESLTFCMFITECKGLHMILKLTTMIACNMNGTDINTIFW